MKNQPGNMKNQPGTMKNHENRLGTMENRPGTINKQKRYKQTHRSFLLYIDKTFFACSQVFPLVAEVFLFVSRTAPSLWIIFCPFVSYNVNWHEDNLSVDHEHRWFVRGEGKFVFHEITSSAVCRWETCCGNILLLAWTPSSSSKCIKARFLFILNLSFYYSSYVGLEF